MMTHTLPSRQIQMTHVVIIMLFLFGIFFSGCAATQQNTATFKDDPQITETFASGQILPDYKYYYSGPVNFPIAILGIHKDYQLRSDLWNEADMLEKQLKAWIAELDDSFRSFKYRYHGAAILDNTGKQVGIWYSMVGSVTVQIKPGNQVVVYTPDNTLIKDVSAPPRRAY